MTRAPHAIFSTRTLALLLGIGLVAFTGTVAIDAFTDPAATGQRSGANSYSTSAIGHFAFVELLRTSGLPVLVSRSRSPEKAGPNDLLVVAEPPARALASGEIDYMLQARNILLVLPKWAGIPDRQKPDWIAQAELRDADGLNTILERINKRLALVRPRRLGGVEISPDGGVPDIANPQLLQHGELDPIIRTKNGILVGGGIRGKSTIWVLSDPDLLSNHGISRGDNASLALTIVKRLVRPGGAIVVDETLHGFRVEPNLLRALFQRPFVVATILFVASVAILVWAVTGRFGSPIAPPTGQRAGKFVLVDNISVLLTFSGSRAEILRRFLSQVTREVAQIFHVPHRLPDDQKTAWLDRVGKARNVTDSLAFLQREARALGRKKKLIDREIVGVAARAFRWRQEMTHGPERNRSR